MKLYGSFIHIKRANIISSRMLHEHNEHVDIGIQIDDQLIEMSLDEFLSRISGHTPESGNDHMLKNITAMLNALRSDHIKLIAENKELKKKLPQNIEE